jgi:hypothetical protein
VPRFGVSILQEQQLARNDLVNAQADHQPGGQQTIRQEVRCSGRYAGAHLLLQTRTRVLNEDLDDLFRRWHPKFRSQPQTKDPERKAT